MPMPMVNVPLQPDPAIAMAVAKAEEAAAKAAMTEAKTKETEAKERMKKMGKAASGVSKLIIPVGIIALSYYVLKTWKVIGTAGSSWEALPEGELTYLEELVNSI